MSEIHPYRSQNFITSFVDNFLRMVISLRLVTLAVVDQQQRQPKA